MSTRLYSPFKVPSGTPPPTRVRSEFLLDIDSTAGSAPLLPNQSAGSFHLVAACSKVYALVMLVPQAIHWLGSVLCGDQALNESSKTPLRSSSPLLGYLRALVALSWPGVVGYKSQYGSLDGRDREYLHGAKNMISQISPSRNIMSTLEELEYVLFRRSVSRSIDATS